MVELVFLLECYLAFQHASFVAARSQAGRIINLCMRLGALGPRQRLDHLTGAGEFGPDHVSPAGREVTVVAAILLVGRLLPAIHVFLHDVTGPAEERLGAEVEKERRDQAEDHHHR